VRSPAPPPDPDRRPVVLPLGEGWWRGPTPSTPGVAEAVRAGGWEAGPRLADGATAWRVAEARPTDAATASPEAARIRSALDAAHAAHADFPAEPPRLLAVLNLTPDSFSDGGRLLDDAGRPRRGAVLAAAEQLVADGADALDLGAESTRPGAAPVPAEVQCARLLPALEWLLPLGVPLALDTRSAAVARAGLAAGASWVNDVSGLRHDPELAAVAAAADCTLVLMHMRGEPADMRERCDYRHLLGEVADELMDAVARALAAGVRRERILLDPGLGFAKDAEQTREMVARLGALRALGFPLLAGPSRKSFLAGLTDAPPTERDCATLGAAALCAAGGAAWLRLHDCRGRDAVRTAWGCARAAHLARAEASGAAAEGPADAVPAPTPPSPGAATAPPACSEGPTLL